MGWARPKRAASPSRQPCAQAPARPPAAPASALRSPASVPCGSRARATLQATEKATTKTCHLAPWPHGGAALPPVPTASRTTPAVSGKPEERAGFPPHIGKAVLGDQEWDYVVDEDATGEDGVETARDEAGVAELEEEVRGSRVHGVAELEEEVRGSRVQGSKQQTREFPQSGQ